MAEFVFHLYCCCLLALFNGIDSFTTRQDMHNLQTKLLTNYDKDLSPNNDQTDPVTVYVSFNMFSLKEFDDVNGKLAILGTFSITWNDDRMIWDPQQYGNITSVSLAESKVWIPLAVVGKPYNELKRIGHDFTRVLYEYNGNASLVVTDFFEVSCSANVAYFPFDRQICVIFFIPTGYHPSFFSLKLPFNSMIFDNFTESGRWKVHSSKMNVEPVIGGGELIRMVLIFERRPLFIVLNLLFPIYILCYLNIFIFILPPEPGERIAFGTTILLSLAVFLSIVSDKLPSSSEPHIARLTVYLLLQLLSSSVTVVMAIFGLRIYKVEADRPIPNWIRKFFTCVSQKHKTVVTKRNSTSSVEESVAATNKQLWKLSESGYYIYSGVHRMSNENGNFVTKNIDKQINENTLVRPCSQTAKSEKQAKESTHNNLTWNCVAQYYDRVCLIGFIFVNLCLLLFEVIDLVIYLNCEFE